MDRGCETRIDYEYIEKCDLVDSVCGDVGHLSSINWCILSQYEVKYSSVMEYL